MIPPKIYNPELEINTCNSIEWFPDPILHSGSSDTDGVISIMVGASGVTGWTDSFGSETSLISSTGSEVVSLTESETES